MSEYHLFSKHERPHRLYAWFFANRRHSPMFSTQRELARWWMESPNIGFDDLGGAPYLSVDGADWVLVR